MLRGLPLLGRAARWAYGLYKAPERIRDLLTLIRLGEDVLKRARIEQANLRVEYANLEEGLAGLSQALQDHEAGVGDLNDRLAGVTERAADLGRSLADAEIRLGALQAEVAGMQAPLAAVSAVQEEERRRAAAVAAIYPRLESHFRGPRALIKERQRIYLPYLVEAGVADKGLPVLDLGCGRGEWLELLTENGFAARGVEQNQDLARECRRRGLSVEEGEAGLFLSHLEPGSMGTVTAFHLLEHLSFASWLKLLHEMVRVLAPGGMALFETPNPENILVSSGDFFLDPTHERPIPSRLLCHVAKTAGLARCRVLELHPRGDVGQEPAADAEPLLARHFLGPQDYALLAWKD
jgi:SAM-dependent methyltransferase